MSKEKLIFGHKPIVFWLFITVAGILVLMLLIMLLSQTKCESLYEDQGVIPPECRDEIYKKRTNNSLN